MTLKILILILAQKCVLILIATYFSILKSNKNNKIIIVSSINTRFFKYNPYFIARILYYIIVMHEGYYFTPDIVGLVSVKVGLLILSTSMLPGLTWSAIYNIYGDVISTFNQYQLNCIPKGFLKLAEFLYNNVQESLVNHVYHEPEIFFDEDYYKEQKAKYAAIKQEQIQFPERFKDEFYFKDSHDDESAAPKPNFDDAYHKKMDGRDGLHRVELPDIATAELSMKELYNDEALSNDMLEPPFDEDFYNKKMAKSVVLQQDVVPEKFEGLGIKTSDGSPDAPTPFNWSLVVLIGGLVGCGIVVGASIFYGAPILPTTYII
jgi:hypothetical protein